MLQQLEVQPAPYQIRIQNELHMHHYRCSTALQRTSSCVL